MEIIKRKENHKKPINTAKRNCYALGAVEIVIGAVIFTSQVALAIPLVILGVTLLVAGYFLSKEKIIGVYLSWAVVLIGTLTVLYNMAFIALIVVAYFAYWTYKAQKAMKIEVSDNVVQ